MAKCGFTLGKFAPFHKGHEWMMCKALEVVDELVVVIYRCDELPHISLSTRANWIRKRFPQVTVLEAHNGPKDQGYSQHVIEIQNQFLTQFLKDYKFNYFFSSEAYGDHVAKALDSEDFRIDMQRAKIPISATQIRADLFHHRRFLSEEVYKDLIRKIVFLGAPSTGKSTLCKALADKYNTLWVEEYGREYWQAHQVNRRLTPEQLLHIGQSQVALEEERLAEANQFLFCDTNAFTTWHFALHYHDSALPELQRLAQQSWLRYDLVVLCEEDIPYDDTWERSGDANRHEFQTFLKAYMHEHNKPYLLVSGTLEQRMAKVEEKLAQMSLQACKD
ncbi:AAA family ATPase [Aliiglaciecola litoralis]|uniref:Multifunctional transcriptional regulator/nicotinamide-nucleotide adenylyltransferase/ribosylnicotinamide kinase NadR n=1 Tax=Aliiglaciecola litoralis TaxID=582857 RepID=A0ABP3WV50_9ALTE